VREGGGGGRAKHPSATATHTKNAQMDGDNAAHARERLDALFPLSRATVLQGPPRIKSQGFHCAEMPMHVL
jgi:hypothetical protein